jgi:hypothetical protein
MSFLVSLVRGGQITLNLTGPLSLSVTQVRWRIPRWTKQNASKMFYVRKPTPIDPEEEEELKIRYSHYNTKRKSLKYVVKPNLWLQTNRTLDNSYPFPTRT